MLEYEVRNGIVVFNSCDMFSLLILPLNQCIKMTQNCNLNNFNKDWVFISKFIIIKKQRIWGIHPWHKISTCIAKHIQKSKEQPLAPSWPEFFCTNNLHRLERHNTTNSGPIEKKKDILNQNQKYVCIKAVYCFSNTKQNLWLEMSFGAIFYKNG